MSQATDVDVVRLGNKDMSNSVQSYGDAAVNCTHAPGVLSPFVVTVPISVRLVPMSFPLHSSGKICNPPDIEPPHCDG